MTRRLLGVFALAAWALIGLFLPGYYRFLYYEVIAWAFLALSVDILYGQVGLLSFGQSVFLGLGSYLFLHLAPSSGLGILGAGLVAVISSLVVGAFVGFLLVRLDGHYFVIATVILALGAFLVASSLTNLTGGDDGLPLTSLPTTLIASVQLPWDLREKPEIAFAVIGLLGATSFSWIWRLRLSIVGLLAAGIKGAPFRMGVLGFPVVSIKYLFWCVAASISALGGVLIVLVTRYASATQFHWTLSGEGVVWAILGGVDTVWGAWLGAAALVTLKDLLSTHFAYYPVIVGGLLVVLVHLRSRGLLRSITELSGAGGIWRRVRERDARRLAQAHALAESGRVGESGRLLLSRVGKKFQGTTALDNCTIELTASRFDVELSDGRVATFRGEEGRHPALALIGPNGAGKTTLLNVICGYLKPDTGVVTWDSLPVKGPRPIAEIGRSFQETQLAEDLSVLENLLLGGLCRYPWRTYWRRVAKDNHLLVSVAGLASRLGLAEYLDRAAGHLSFGKRKVLDIGMALAGHPQLLVLDEPTAGVSPRELIDLLDLIREVTRWVPVVLVEHNLDALRRLNFDVVFMANGRLLEYGKLDPLLAHETVREEFTGLRVARAGGG